MAAEFYNITLDEMTEFLGAKGFTKLDLAGVTEVVFGKFIRRGPHALTLRVFTGISPTGNSRGVGEDAIRCTLFWRRPDKTIVPVGGSKRVHRVVGWRKNLDARLENFFCDYPGDCPVCGAPMVLRKSSHGKFFGCGNYPNCKGVRNA